MLAQYNQELQINLFGFIYWYVASLLMGHYAAHNVKPTKKWKYKKGKNDTFVALPVAGFTTAVILFLLSLYNILGNRGYHQYLYT